MASKKIYNLTLTPTMSVDQRDDSLSPSPPPVTTTTSSGTSSTAKTTGTSSAKVVKARGKFTRAQTMVGTLIASAESTRLKQDEERSANWKRWGPYLSERQWATVREDYSADGSW